jgi:hypothetical protein
MTYLFFDLEGNMSLSPTSSALDPLASAPLAEQNINALHGQISSVHHPRIDAFCEQAAQEIVDRSLKALRLCLDTGQERNELHKLENRVKIELISPTSGLWNPFGSHLIDQVAQATGFFWFTPDECAQLIEAGFEPEGGMLWIDPQLRRLAYTRIDFAWTRIVNKVIQKLWEETRDPKSSFENLDFTVNCQQNQIQHSGQRRHPNESSIELALWINSTRMERSMRWMKGSCYPCT